MSPIRSAPASLTAWDDREATSLASLLSFAFLPPLSAAGTLAVATAGFFFLSPTLLSLATYTAEIYPTHLRALGGGVASSWQRGASVVGTTVVGWVLPSFGINAVFAQR